MENIIAVLVLAVLIGGAAAYLVRAKRSGVKCVGCPAGGNCSSRHKKKKKKLTGAVIAEKNYHYLRNALCALCTKRDRQPEPD